MALQLEVDNKTREVCHFISYGATENIGMENVEKAKT